MIKVSTVPSMAEVSRPIPAALSIAVVSQRLAADQATSNAQQGPH